MIDEKKVKLMTDAAMAKKKSGRGVFHFCWFFGDDYVSFQAIKAWIGITCAYVLIVLLWVLSKAEELMTEYSVARLFAMIKGFAIFYFIVACIGLLICILVYTEQFWKTNEAVKEYQADLRKLRRLYQKEEKEQEERYGKNPDISTKN